MRIKSELKVFGFLFAIFLIITLSNVIPKEEKFPDFLSDNSSVDLYSGEKVIFSFSIDDCSICLKSLEILNQLSIKNSQKVEIVGIFAASESYVFEKIKKYYHLNFPLLWDRENIVKSTFGKNIMHKPILFLLKDGIILKKAFIGVKSDRKKVKEIFDYLKDRS